MNSFAYPQSSRIYQGKNAFMLYILNLPKDGGHLLLAQNSGQAFFGISQILSSAKYLRCGKLRITSTTD